MSSRDFKIFATNIAIYKANEKIYALNIRIIKNNNKFFSFYISFFGGRFWNRCINLKKGGEPFSCLRIIAASLINQESFLKNQKKGYRFTVNINPEKKIRNMSSPYFF